MAMGPSEFLKSLTAEELSDVIDRNIDEAEQGTPETVSLVDLLYEDYPELALYVEENIGRLQGAEGLTDDEVFNIKLTAIVSIAAICRLAEMRDLPPLEQ